MYQDLVDMERKLDWTVMRKKVEIEDAISKVPPVCTKAVVWVLN
jgi:SWI/SNF-related matrix-associated actin-dependent regulator of chromatin subfamily D